MGTLTLDPTISRALESIRRAIDPQNKGTVPHPAPYPPAEPSRSLESPSGDPRRPALSFFVPGPPQVKQRPRLGKGGNVYTPSATWKYEQSVGWEAKRAMGKQHVTKFTGPVSVVISFVIAQPKVLKTLLPPGDVDNYIKAVLDGMNHIVFGDDGQVVQLTACKKYGADAGTQVTVEHA